MKKNPYRKKLPAGVSIKPARSLTKAGIKEYVKQITGKKDYIGRDARANLKANQLSGSLIGHSGKISKATAIKIGKSLMEAKLTPKSITMNELKKKYNDVAKHANYAEFAAKNRTETMHEHTIEAYKEQRDQEAIKKERRKLQKEAKKEKIRAFYVADAKKRIARAKGDHNEEVLGRSGRANYRSDNKADVLSRVRGEDGDESNGLNQSDKNSQSDNSVQTESEVSADGPDNQSRTEPPALLNI